MRKTTLALAAALALGAATISTGVMTTPVMARGMSHGGHVGARVAGGGGWHGGGGNWRGGGGWRGGGWGPAGVALGLGLGLGGLYAYGGAPYGYCGGYAGYPGYYGYNNCGYGGYYNGW
jgi:hypothetical protein